MADVATNVIINAIVNGLQNISNLGNSFNNASQQIDSASNRLTKFDAISNGLFNLSGYLQSVADKFALVGGAIAGLISGNNKAAVDFDTIYRSLVFVSGGASAANLKLRELNEVAKLPGLGFREAILGQTQLQATLKLTSDTVTKTIAAIGKGVAVSGGSKAQLEGTLFQLTQIAGRGKFEGEDVNTISEKVRNFKVALQQEFGTVKPIELNKIVDAEGIDKVFDRISNRLNELNKNATNLDGAQNSIDNFTDAIYKLQVALGTPYLQVFGEALNFVSTALTVITEYFQNLSPATKQVLAIISLLALAFITVSTAVIGIAATITGAIAAFAGLSLLLGGVGAAFAALAIPIVAIIGIMIAIIEIALLVAASIFILQRAYKENWGNIQQTVKDASDAVNAEMERLKQIFIFFYEQILPKLQQTVENVLNAVKQYWEANGEAITNYVKIAWEFIKSTIEGTMFFVGELIASVLDAINGDWSRAWNLFQIVFMAAVDGVISAVLFFASTLPLLVLGLLVKTVQVIYDFNAKIITAAINLAVNFVKGFYEYAKENFVQSVGDVATFGLTALYRNAKEWYDAGKTLSQNLKDGFESNKLRIAEDIQKSEDIENFRALRETFDAFRQKKQRDDEVAKLAQAGKGGSGKTKKSDIEPIDAEARAKAKAAIQESERAIELETKKVEFAFTRRKLASIDYYNQLEALSNRSIDNSIKEQEQVIARANEQLGDSRINGLDDRGKKADQLRAQIIDAESKIADLQQKRAETQLENDKKQFDFAQQLTDAYNQQIERIADIRGEFDKLGEIRVSNMFDEKIEDITREVEGLGVALANAIVANDQVLADRYTTYIDVARKYLTNLKFEKEIAAIYESQKKVERELASIDTIGVDNNLTEAEESAEVIRRLTIAVDDLREARLRLKNAGANTVDADAKIKATEELLFRQKINDIDLEHNKILEAKQRQLEQLALFQKSTGADQTVIDAKRNEIDKNFADQINNVTIPALEALADTYKEGSVQAKLLKTRIDNLKASVDNDKSPDAANDLAKQFKKARDVYDGMIKSRDAALRDNERDTDTSSTGIQQKRNVIIKTYNGFLRQTLKLMKDVLKANENTWNADQIQDYKDEIASLNQSIEDSETQVISIGTQIKDIFFEAISSGIDTLFDDLASGAKTAGQAFLDFGANLVMAIGQAILKMLVLLAIMTLFNSIGAAFGNPALGTQLVGNISGGGGLTAGRAMGGSLQGLAMGGQPKINPLGLVNGAGSGTSDSILAYFDSVGKSVKLSNKEFVIDAQTVANVGVGTFDDILKTKGRILQPIMRRSMGGSMDDSLSARASSINPIVNAKQDSAGDTNLNVHVGLSSGEMVQRGLIDKRGNTAFVDAIGNNKAKIKTLLEIK